MAAADGAESGEVGLRERRPNTPHELVLRETIRSRCVRSFQGVLYLTKTCKEKGLAGLQGEGESAKGKKAGPMGQNVANGN